MLNDAQLIFCFSQREAGKLQCVSLKESAKANIYGSDSVILSLAAKITFVLPYLDLTPTPENTPFIIPEKKEINQYVTYHPLQQFWCDAIVQAMTLNQCIRKNQTLFVVLPLNKEEFEKVEASQGLDAHFEFRQLQLKEGETPSDTCLKVYAEYEELPRKMNKRVGYLNVSGRQLDTNIYKPQLNVKAIVMGQIYNNQIWSVYYILKNHIPSVEQFGQMDTVFIPGSTNSVLDDIPTIKTMTERMMQSFYAFQSKMKIIGICYGHQLLSLYHKCEVVHKSRTDRLQVTRFDYQNIEKLSLSFPYLKQLTSQKNKQTVLFEHHGDYVQSVSKQFQLLGKSDSCNVECMVHKNGRILTFQSHPEYYYEIGLSYAMRLNKMASGTSVSVLDMAKEVNRQKLERQVQSARIVRKTICGFINFESDIKVAADIDSCL